MCNFFSATERTNYDYRLHKFMMDDDQTNEGSNSKKKQMKE